MTNRKVRVGDLVLYHHSDDANRPWVTMPAIITSVISEADGRVTLTAFPPPGTRGEPAFRLSVHVLYSAEPARTKWSWPPED
jgi:hypothetical protein